MRIAAQREGKLSGPKLSISSAKAPFEADPDTGRVTRSGNISAGTPIFSPIGESRSVKSSTAPLTENIFRATMIAQRDGRSFTDVESPFLAPEQNVPK